MNLKTMDGSKIIIIGAGLAGLAAAQKLIENSFPNICILEAKNRIGGRVHTAKYDRLASHVEFGAQWIHGEGLNPIFLLAKINGLLDRTDTEDQKYCVFHAQDGKQVSQKIVQKTCDFLENVLQSANGFSREGIPLTCEDDSLGTYVRQEFDKYMINKKNDSKISAIKEAIYNWQKLIQKTENGCQSIDELSLYSWGQYLEFEGSEEVVLKHGYDPILEIISANIPEQCFHLETEVRTIKLGEKNGENPDSWSNEEENDSVTVELTNGKIMTADYVIFTGSVGVLKAHAQSLFNPSLPEDKLSVIDRMGFGTVNKIYLEFEKPFWDKDIDGIQLLWFPDSEPFSLKCLDEATLEQYGEWYKSIHGFSVVDHHTNLLCAWIAGNDAKIMESIPDDVITNVCVELLRRFTGNNRVTLPRRIYRSQWSRDPHVFGSYSYIKAGQTADDCDVLAEPLPDRENPRLLFAGEATDRRYFSTTHAAYLSGQREAERIIRHVTSEN